jgi:glycerol-3-phosphate acyltransferase PlsY
MIYAEFTGGDGAATYAGAQLCDPSDRSTWRNATACMSFPGQEQVGRKMLVMLVMLVMVVMVVMVVVMVVTIEVIIQ